MRKIKFVHIFVRVVILAAATSFCMYILTNIVIFRKYLFNKSSNSPKSSHGVNNTNFISAEIAGCFKSLEIQKLSILMNVSEVQEAMKIFDDLRFDYCPTWLKTKDCIFKHLRGKLTTKELILNSTAEDVNQNFVILPSEFLCRDDGSYRRFMYLSLVKHGFTACYLQSKALADEIINHYLIFHQNIGITKFIEAFSLYMQGFIKLCDNMGNFSSTVIEFEWKSATDAAKDTVKLFWDEYQSTSFTDV